MRLLLIVVVTVGVLVAPTVRVAAQSEPEVLPGLGIRLIEAPVDRRDDPRARTYVIDHLRPGAEISRAFEVTNGTEEPLDLRLGVVPAELRDGSFLPGASDDVGDLPAWSTVDPAGVQVPPGERRRARVTIRVPEDASDGERYGMVVAESPPAGGGPVQVASRVGIRVYLSVGEGGEPASDFVVDSLTAARDDGGRPVVLARVENTGGRALDMRGELRLEEGPGELTAGPFPAELGTTIPPGGSSPVRVVLDPGLPDGPWLATVTLRSGTLERSARAEIAFPAEPGTSAAPVEADAVERQRRIAIPLAAAAILLVLAGLVASAVRSRAWRRLLRRG